MPNLTNVPTSTRFECTLKGVPGSGYRHLSGTGRPTRKRCECGGQFIVQTVRYGVHLHSSYGGTVYYRPEDAISVHARERTAERACEVLNAQDQAAGRPMRHVVRVHLVH